VLAPIRITCCSRVCISQRGRPSCDLLSLMGWMAPAQPHLLANLHHWIYPNGMGAARCFANRHEYIAWFRAARNTFRLDAVLQAARS